MKGELCIMDMSGDTRIIWDSDNPVEVEHARSTFDSFKKKNYLAYKTDKKGEKGEIMRSFDPLAEKMILVPQIAGG